MAETDSPFKIQKNALRWASEKGPISGVCPTCHSM